MRHVLANALYAAARKVDRGPVRMAPGGGLRFGERSANPDRDRHDLSSTTINLHLRDASAIHGTFQPGSFTYSALTLGDEGAAVTVFLGARTTARMIDVLRQVQDAGRTYGWGER